MRARFKIDILFPVNKATPIFRAFMRGFDDNMRMTRRNFLGSALTGCAATRLLAAPRKWPLGINTYCLRFQRWNDRQLIDYCAKQKLDAVFLQDSLDPAVMDPRHWAEVRKSCQDLGLHLETGGAAL